MEPIHWLTIHFSVSGIETNLLIPPLVAFAVSFFTSMGGVSGAFMLLPFQVSVLGYTAPSVSATNQVFNIVAIPSGVWRYLKERRMVWPLTWAVIIGTLPGVFIGAWVRIEYLPDPKNFKFFAGFVLLYIGARLLFDVVKMRKQSASARKQSHSLPERFVVSDTRFSLKKVEFHFAGRTYKCSTLAILLVCFLVGIAGGIYGIGGGAIIAPFFVSIFKLPIYTVAGAALMGTFATSVAGVAFYQILSTWRPSESIAPDWFLGILFGFGGLLGMYLGARCQKNVPAHVIKIILCVCVLFVAAKYIIGFF
jgi:uncharacterized membrane protein YfcA